MYLLAKQIFEASVQFYVILVQVAKQLICPQDFSDANQLKTRMTTEMQNAWRQKRNGKKRKKKKSNNVYCMYM